MRNSVQSVNRALTILEMLSKYPNGLGVTEIAHEMDVAKSTVHRLLSSLLSYDFVSKDPNSHYYKLGLKLLYLGNEVSKSLDIRSVSLPFLKKLSQQTGETVHLAIYDQGEVVYIEKIESSALLRMYSQIGIRAPAHCTGLGKAILSQKSEQEIDDFIHTKGLHQFTDNTLTTKTALMKALREAKALGYAYDDEEHERGIRCAASPIFNFRNEVIGAISVAGPTTRITEEKLKELCTQVKKIAIDISTAMGMTRK